MEKITTIGLDIAKHVFQVHGINGAGAIVSRRKLRRGGACGHHHREGIGRALARQRRLLQAIDCPRRC